MAKKMDFLDFVSDLPDEEGDAVEVKTEAQGELAEEIQGSIPPGIYYKVNSTKVVLIKNNGCKKKQ